MIIKFEDKGGEKIKCIGGNIYVRMDNRRGLMPQGKAKW